MVHFKLDKFLSAEDVAASGFYRKLKVSEQLKVGRTTTPETLSWWKEQGEEARTVLEPSSEDVSVNKFHYDLKEYLEQSGYNFKNDFIWVRGAAFDPPLIDSLFDDFGLKNPMNFWKIRDIRTFVDMVTGSRNGKYENKYSPDWLVKHDALHDCVIDYQLFKELHEGNIE
jgi:hypothetical protein